MKFVPTAISRKIADQALLGKKHSPTILFGAGIVSMVGSTVLACRATLKLEDALHEIEAQKHQAERVSELVNSDEYTGSQTYTDAEKAQDLTIISIRGVVSITRLYAPALILGGVGVICLTKSHKILEERNAALTAAYVALDQVFRTYRSRVVERYGEDADREMRYESEQVTVIDEETGKAFDTVRVTDTEHGLYARWFDETNRNFHPAPWEDHNWFFLRCQQNWANDMLHSRGHLFLNEVYSMLGLAHTNAGAVVGWVYKRNNDRGDNYVDFGCWGEDGQGLDFFHGSNGREDAILLDFNVDGPIWELMDELRAQKEAEEAAEVEET